MKECVFRAGARIFRSETIFFLKRTKRLETYALVLGVHTLPTTRRRWHAFLAARSIVLFRIEMRFLL